MSRLLVNIDGVVGRSQRRQITGTHPIVQGGLDEPAIAPKFDLAADERGYRDSLPHCIPWSRHAGLNDS